MEDEKFPRAFDECPKLSRYHKYYAYEECDHYLFSVRFSVVTSISIHIRAIVPIEFAYRLHC